MQALMLLGLIVKMQALMLLCVALKVVLEVDSNQVSWTTGTSKKVTPGHLNNGCIDANVTLLGKQLIQHL